MYLSAIISPDKLYRRYEIIFSKSYSAVSKIFTIYFFILFAPVFYILSILEKASSREYTLFSFISFNPFFSFSFKSFLLFIVTLSGASVSTYENFKYLIKFITLFVSSSGNVSISLYNFYFSIDI